MNVKESEEVSDDKFMQDDEEFSELQKEAYKPALTSRQVNKHNK